MQLTKGIRRFFLPLSKDEPALQDKEMDLTVLGSRALRP